MKPTPPLPDAAQRHLVEQIEKLLDGSLDPTETAALEQSLRDDPAALELAARTVHLHGSIRAEAPALRRFLEHENVSAPSAAPAGFRIMPWIIASAACAALLAVLAFQSPFPAPAPAPAATNSPEKAETVATLVEAANCRWAASSLPTVVPSEVGPGTYDLVEGLAKIRFATGAELTLEAPATLRIIDALNCRLEKGAIVVTVPPSAIGFTVDTPEAKIIDFGTTFGVIAGPNGHYVVQVVDGLVELKDKNSGIARSLTTGKWVSVGGEPAHPSGAVSEESLHSGRGKPFVPLADGWHHIPSGVGRGADTFIQAGGFPGTISALHDFGNSHILRVKRADVDFKTNRKAYFRFDLSGLPEKAITEAEFVLSIEPSDIGFASWVPDSTFSVYGLVDESEDAWDEFGLTWENAPAHDPAQKLLHTPVPSKAIKLGEFTIPRGRTSGTVSVGGEETVEFLRRDTNRLVTFIVCRDTDETAKGGIAHVFASKESRTSTAPALKVKLAE
jgi:ferric-dicitrate binding protein FerR (iron transport regulator)